MTLVCFAVKEEANAFQALARQRPEIQVLLTGIGPRNAGKAIRAALADHKPDLVISSGFAGGLRPGLAPGTIVFAAEAEIRLEPVLLAGGALPVRFHCAEKIATTVGQKRALRQQTGADAVEMESEILLSFCREQKIAFATIRVILDPAEEDLPLDFNALLNVEQKMDAGKLAWALAKAPTKVAALLRLQKQSKTAAAKLARVLGEILGIGA